MNREILFRGKRCSDGKWVYGFYVESKYSWKGHKPHKSWIVPNAISNGGFFNVLGRYAVNDDTVGQYTGLKDKNGTEIYEGDIISFVDGLKQVNGEWIDNEHIYSVEYSEASFKGVCGLSKCLDAVEVIGNIYDNQDLLYKK